MTQTITAASDLHFAQIPITRPVLATDTLLMQWLSSCYANGAGPFGTASNFEATATSAATPSSQTTQSSTAGLSTGAEAGIGVGIGVGVLLLLGLAFFAVRRRRTSRKYGPKQETEVSAYEKDPNDEIQRPQELDPTSRRGELPTGKEAHELAAKSKTGEVQEMDAPQLHELSTN